VSYTSEQIREAVEGLRRVIDPLYVSNDHLDHMLRILDRHSPVWRGGSWHDHDPVCRNQWVRGENVRSWPCDEVADVIRQLRDLGALK
jgi:hypothetical protein